MQVMKFMVIAPTVSILGGYSGNNLACTIGTPVLASGSADCQEQSRRAEVTANGSVTISETAAGEGIWVPYVPSRTLYGWSAAGAKWMGTGPFSGCHIAFFTDGARVGMAHIAKESSTSASTDAWTAFTQQGGITVLNEWKVPLPDQTRYSASYIFLDLSAQKPSMARLDVHVTGMGGSDGAIFGVQKVL
jgi:hypothetical protein